MNTLKQLSQFGSVPFSRGALVSVLAEYHRPNDKISSLIAQGVLIPLKKGLYLLGDEYRSEPVCLPNVANLLYGPSCVSLEFALAWHGLIPEAVYGVTSVTSRRSKTYDTPLGRFSYLHLLGELFRVGLQMEQTADGKTFLMAGPEKALCDKILLTRNVRVESVGGMRVFLEEDLRIDMEELVDFDGSVIEGYLSAGRKVRHLEFLKGVLEELR